MRRVPSESDQVSERAFLRSWHLSWNLKDKKEPGFASTRGRGSERRNELVQRPRKDRSEPSVAAVGRWAAESWGFTAAVGTHSMICART